MKKECKLTMKGNYKMAQLSHDLIVAQFLFRDVW